ncbi:MAG TPA: NCS2 family permease [Gemmatimonadales bacterium]|jgi:AGZA family xanthine/uracil permease-like MFS transporter
MLERRFRLRDAGTTVRAELVGGATTFVTLSYIIFVQPAVLGVASMDFGSVLVATCLASAFATAVMGLYANYPIAVAPAMGHNFFFAYTVVVGMGVPWQVALGADFVAGVLFVALSAFHFREAVMDTIPGSLKAAIPVGIGLLITFVGMQWGGIVVASPGSLVKLGRLTAPPTLLALGGFLLIAVLNLRRVSGAILIGILATTATGAMLGLLPYRGIIGAPPSIAPTLLKLDVAGALEPRFVEVVFVFLFLAIFDTVGTLIGVSTQAGLMREGKLPRAGRALLADAVGTTAGTLLGTSTVTAYIESAAGVAAGARTGLANLATALLLLLSVFFYPLAQLMGGGVDAGGVTLHPVTAAALMTIGYLMIGNVTSIRWDDLGEAIPAFLTIVTMPLSFSIADGLAIGFISYALLQVLSGRGRQVSWLAYLFALLFVLRLALL